MILMTGRGSEHSRRVVQSAEKYFFHEKNIFSHRFKKATQTVSDLIPHAGGRPGASKTINFHDF